MTLRPRSVIDAITSYYRDHPSCGASRGRPLGNRYNWFQDEVSSLEQNARKAMAHFIGAQNAEEIHWTKNTTEAINVVANSVALDKHGTIVLSLKEHNSNYVPWLRIQNRARARYSDDRLSSIVAVPTNQEGNTCINGVLNAIDDRTRIVTLGMTNNVDGSSLREEDITRVRDKAHRHGALLLLDAAQWVGHRPLDVGRLGADFVAFSLHKMCGPNLGVLYAKSSAAIRLEPLAVGGGTVADVHEGGYEPTAGPALLEAGLQDYAAITSVPVVIEFLNRLTYEVVTRNALAVNDVLTKCLLSLDSDLVWILGSQDPTNRPSILTIGSALPNIPTLIETLGDKRLNLMVRSGMMCGNVFLKTNAASKVHPANNVRLSLYAYNTIEEAEAFCSLLRKIISRRLYLRLSS
jgi:cysteine desulfurase/selenocysteine lyase